jgi:hypothetical protein
MRELERLGLEVSGEAAGSLLVSGDPTDAVSRATYFQSVELEDERSLQTDQARVEAAHLDRRATKTARQATRYGVHGIHEYKGKFNPQVVRSLCNVVDPDADVLVDPFCGSGTAPLEGLRLGLSVLGVDRSPMAWFLASAKLAAAAERDKRDLGTAFRRLTEITVQALDRGQSSGRQCDLAPELGKPTADYLRGWFTAPAFAALSAALVRLKTVPESTARRLCLVALSSILRSVSLQLPEDLRIRRRPEPFEAPRLADAFAAAAAEISEGLSEMSRWGEPAGRHTIVHGSADDAGAYGSVSHHRRRLILTSPPYATALPYIDTDRLSILALGLAEAPAILPLERELLGSREWVRAQRATWDARRAVNADEMPSEVTSLLDDIHQKNAGSGAGFRRLAVPSLLYRYFVGMAEVMTAWFEVLAPGENAVLIIGHNRTTAGGELVDIATPDLLGEVAISRGFEVRELIRLETWPRYGLHSANGVPGEDALIIARPR